MTSFWIHVDFRCRRRSSSLSAVKSCVVQRPQQRLDKSGCRLENGCRVQGASLEQRPKTNDVRTPTGCRLFDCVHSTRSCSDLRLLCLSPSLVLSRDRAHPSSIAFCRSCHHPTSSATKWALNLAVARPLRREERLQAAVDSEAVLPQVSPSAALLQLPMLAKQHSPSEAWPQVTVEVGSVLGVQVEAPTPKLPHPLRFPLDPAPQL